jgi:prepilin-type N-terminal cleavage/methylation domain-containing protein
MTRYNAEKGFTLVELLVVIAIIGVLAGMIVGITGMARARAYLAKTKSNMSAMATALEAYNTLTGVYPGAGKTGKASDDPWAMFLALYTGNPKIGGSRENHLGDWPLEAIGVWPDGFAWPYAEPTEDDVDYSNGVRKKCVFLDPWGRAYHYVEFESRTKTDREIASGQLKARGGQSYAIWSDGPNGQNEFGKGDDINSWSEGGRAKTTGASAGGS